MLRLLCTELAKKGQLRSKAVSAWLPLTIDEHTVENRSGAFYFVSSYCSLEEWQISDIGSRIAKLTLCKFLMKDAYLALGFLTS